jgi:hypothetical protein
MERDLLIRALAIRRLEQIREDPSLFLETATYGEWARTEADHLTRILDCLQGADLPQGGGQ